MYKEDLISISEAASILKLDRSRVGKLCRQDRFFNARKIGHTWVIPREAVLTFERLPPGKKVYKGQPTNKVIIKKALRENEASKELIKDSLTNDNQIFQKTGVLRG